MGKLFLSRQILLTCDKIVIFYVKWHLVNCSLRYIVDHPSLHFPGYPIWIQTQEGDAVVPRNLFTTYVVHVWALISLLQSNQVSSLPKISKETGTPTQNLIRWQYGHVFIPRSWPRDWLQVCMSESRHVSKHRKAPPASRPLRCVTPRI